MNTTATNSNNLERIQKVISNYGNYSRREVEKLITDKKVFVNNELAVLGQKVSINDKIVVNGKLVNFTTKHVYFLVYKPKGFISSRVDEKNKRVIDLVPNSNNRNLFTIGRLDVNTTGLIIVTSDGWLAQKINTPKNKVPKTYLVWLEKPVKKQDIYKIHTGIKIDEETTTLPIKKVKIISNLEKNVLVKMTIYEGKQNQIKRMFEFLDNEVINLKRIQIGGLILDNNIKQGKYKKLQQQEIYDALGVKK